MIRYPTYYSGYQDFCKTKKYQLYILTIYYSSSIPILVKNSENLFTILWIASCYEMKKYRKIYISGRTLFY